MENRVKSRRLELGLSQAALARRAKMNQTHVGEIERQERVAWPKAVEEISLALGVDAQTLFDERGFAREADD